MSVWDNFAIAQGTVEPGGLKIALNGGAAILNGYIPTDDLETILEEGLETAYADNSTGRLVRTLPVAHPRHPWLFLRDIPSLQGVSFIGKVASDPDSTLEVIPLPAFSDYRKYKTTMTFEPRPYLQTTDDRIPQETITWYTDDGLNHNSQVWDEWFRYTTFYPEPASETLVAEIGQLRWATDLTIPPGAPDPKKPVDGSGVGGGVTRLLMPSMTWKVTWFAVPYGYVLSNKNAFLTAIGRINQLDWAGYSAGSMLLQAVNVLRIYPPPFPDFVPYDGYDLVGQDKLCDLEFTMLEVKRVAGTTIVPDNPSHIASGHNVLPYKATHQFYYAESFRGTGAAGTGEPPYLSYPFQFLFQNPDWLT